MIRRHSLSAIIMHWFNGSCWIFLLFSGFALLGNPETQPIGRWWVALWTGFFGEGGLLSVHKFVGLLWCGVYTIYLLFKFRSEGWPFIKEITKLRPASDGMWCLKKALWLITSAKTMRRVGIDPALPEQGFYNAGQKLVAIIAVLSSALLMITGLMMVGWGNTPGFEVVLQWSILVHFCSAGIMAIFIPVHIYMAALAPGEKPALCSMFTGHVPVEFIKHHNTLWYNQLQKENRIPADNATDSK